MRGSVKSSTFVRKTLCVNILRISGCWQQVNPRMIRLIHLEKFPTKKKNTFPLFVSLEMILSALTLTSTCQRSEIQNVLQTRRLGICKSSDASSIDQPLRLLRLPLDVFKLLSCAHTIFTRMHGPLNAAVRKVRQLAQEPQKKKAGETSKLYFPLPLDFPGSVGCPESRFFCLTSPCVPPSYAGMSAYM